MKRQKKCLPFELKGIEIEKNGHYRPLSSFLLNKSVDENGDALKCDASVTYDNEETIAEMESQGKVEAIGVCSPNVDIFDIFERAGSETEDIVETQEVKTE